MSCRHCIPIALSGMMLHIFRPISRAHIPPYTLIFAIVTPAAQECYGASMNWRAVHGRIREIWSAIVEDLPERSKRARGQIKYDDERVFEAALYMVRHNIAMRDLEDERYPSPNPLYLRLAAMVRSRVLDRAWAAYLENASRAELETWAGAFERIRRNRRRSTKGKARRPRAKDKDSPSKPERTGLSPGLAWLEILLRGLEDVCAEKGIDMEPFTGREKR